MSVHVAAVIPTIGRDSLYRAVESVSRQTFPVSEILICNDSAAPLRSFNDPRIRVIETGPRGGGNRARQAGITASSCEVIALLDDDDEWLPHHLESVLRLTEAAAKGDVWIAASRGLLADHSQYPRRKIAASESLLHYLFVLRGGATRKGAMLTSSLVFPRALAERIAWRPELRFHQDLTWLVDVHRIQGHIPIFQLDEPTVLMGDTMGSVSKTINLDASLKWARQELLATTGREDRQAFGDFLLSRYPLKSAVSAHDWAGVRRVAIAAFREGLPSVWAVIYAVALISKEALGLRRSVSRSSSSTAAQDLT